MVRLTAANVRYEFSRAYPKQRVGAPAAALLDHWCGCSDTNTYSCSYAYTITDSDSCSYAPADADTRPNARHEPTNNHQRFSESKFFCRIPMLYVSHVWHDIRLTFLPTYDVWSVTSDL